MLAAKTTFTRWGLTVRGFGAQITSKTRLVITGVSTSSLLSRITQTDLPSKWTWRAKTNSKVIKASNCVSLRLITCRLTAACVFTVSLSASCVIQTPLFCLQMWWRAKRQDLCLILAPQWKKKVLDWQELLCGFSRKKRGGTDNKEFNFFKSRLESYIIRLYCANVMPHHP